MKTAVLGAPVDPMVKGPRPWEKDMYRLYWEYMAGSIVVQAALERIGAP